MFVIGITGGSGAGKTSALRALERLGALTLDSDALYHELLENDGPMQAELRARFPDAFFCGVPDRKKLGAIVFNDESALKDLNAITHKYVTLEIDRRIREYEESGGRVAAVDAIALIESGRGKKCDFVVGVTAPRETRIGRIMARDGITREEAERRINAQKPDSFFKENCDFLLEGVHNTPEEFEERCKEFFTRIIGGRKNAR